MTIAGIALDFVLGLARVRAVPGWHLGPLRQACAPAPSAAAVVPQ
jgi:hypothetical protein